MSTAGIHDGRVNIWNYHTLVSYFGNQSCNHFANIAKNGTSACGLSSPIHLTHAGDGISVAFPPGFAAKQYFYVNDTNTSGNTVISRFSVSTNPDLANPNSEVTNLTVNQPEANHNGGHILFGPDGYLYVGMGDGGGGGNPSGNAQNPATLLGKILRIDVESGTTPYQIPSTNPYRGNSAYRGEIWALGMRNPWRLGFDKQTRDLYIADVGQNAYEEINYQPVGSRGGENYGWNRMEGAHCYNSTTCNQSGLTLPVTEYRTHVNGTCSVTGGTVYRGLSHPQLQGIYIYGDFCGGQLWGLRKVGSTWETRLLLDTPYSITSFGEDEAGNLYLVDYSGGIYLLKAGT